MKNPQTREVAVHKEVLCSYGGRGVGSQGDAGVQGAWGRGVVGGACSCGPLRAEPQSGH